MIKITNPKVVILEPSAKDQIIIIDYGMGNLGSIKNMFKAVGAEAIITSKLEVIKNARKIVLPGVGAFDNGMENIKKMGLLPVLNELVLDKKVPVLGICLGMQLMTRKSEEGKLPGLGWVQADTEKFQSNIGLKIPHMGWNDVKITKNHYLVKNLDQDARFYFVHSYHVVVDAVQDTLMETNYGYAFTSAFQKENIIGVQFHPEKSHKYGMELIKNFAEEKC